MNGYCVFCVKILESEITYKVASRCMRNHLKLVDNIVDL